MYLTVKELESRLRHSAATISRWQRNRGFPKPAIGGGRGAKGLWLEEDVQRWEDLQREKAATE